MKSIKTNEIGEKELYVMEEGDILTGPLKKSQVQLQNATIDNIPQKKVILNQISQAKA